MSITISSSPIEQTIELLSIQEIESSNSFGKFSIQPLTRGFGTTIANSLRRTLLSSIEGWAVVCVRFEYTDEEGAKHILSSEFESIPGIREDTIDIISNLKRLSWNVESEESSIEKHYTFSGESKVMSENFSDGTVKVTEKEVPVFSAMESTNLDIMLVIQKGIGYIPSEEIDTNREYGIISVDALFSPVKNVRFEVLETRVENRNDYEQIILEIETNATVSPKDAIVQAAMVLKKHFGGIIGGSERDVSEMGSSLEDLSRKKILGNTIESLELSVRALNCLKSIDIATIGDLIEKTEAELSTTKNFGRKSLDEIIAALESLNLVLKKE